VIPSFPVKILKDPQSGKLEAGPVCFEAAELAWLGFQPLEAVFAVVGLTIVALAWRTRKTRP
jgi:hypothetical protein